MDKISDQERRAILEQFSRLDRFNSSVWDGVHPLLDQKDVKQVIDVLEQSVPRLLSALDEAYRHIDAIEKSSDKARL